MNGYDTLSLENIATLAKYHIAILMWLCAIATFCNTCPIIFMGLCKFGNKIDKK